MYIIAGLGNPGAKYEGTRHNVGFSVIDALAEKHGISVDKKQFKGLTGRGMIAGQQVLLLKPLTYMNLSGESLRAAFDFYKPELDQVLVIFDDISLETGQLRIRKKGSAGGHNGVKSIISHLGSMDFPRIKVGVGEPSREELVDFVLGRFHGDDVAVMKETVATAVLAVETFLSEGPQEAMNLYNKKKEKKETRHEALE
ncbi:MAG: aminoacyl-tRNA hydrolase [Lachnospiraceae bacterium]|nr:aminoacyl-tRNA hydrolase [Lachnospiraceae bacterium]